MRFVINFYSTDPEDYSSFNGGQKSATVDVLYSGNPKDDVEEAAHQLVKDGDLQEGKTYLAIQDPNCEAVTRELVANYGWLVTIEPPIDAKVTVHVGGL